MILGLDSYQPMTPFVPAIRDAGMRFACRYLKNLTLGEARALSAAGIAVVAIFETTGERALLGRVAGLADGLRARAQMDRLGAPETAAIYLTVDPRSDVREDQVETVEQYFCAADEEIFGHYKIGGYASGMVLDALRADGLDYCWLAGAMGWSGSKAFARSGVPHLVQGPTVGRGRTMSWPPAKLVPRVDPIQWPDLGFDYDPDIALVDEFGQFMVAA